MNLRIIKLSILLFSVSFIIVGCSIGTSLKTYEIKSFTGVSVPSLSSEPVLIEKVSIDLIESEENKQSLNLPLNLLKYNPSSYKVGPGDKLFIYVYGETERLSAALASGAKINPIFEKIVRDDGTIFYLSLIHI